MKATSSFGILKLVIAVTLMVAPQLAHAEKMDVETHTLVIEKLEDVLSHTNLDVARAPIQARLGDLQAERARLLSMQEAEKNCDSCLGSRTDREKALKNYQAAFTALNKNKDRLSGEIDKGAILLQMAHLDELLGNGKSAEALYEIGVSAPAKTFDSNVLSTCHLGLGDILFERGQFAKAWQHYEKAMTLADASKKGYITYRMAWCRLNQGDLDQAIGLLKKILKNPELLKRDTAEGSNIDSSFQEDVAHDLATFYARGPLRDSDIKELLSLTPERSQKENLAYLAAETERLGNKKASLHILAMVSDRDAGPNDKLEVLVRGARLQFDVGQKDKALLNLQKATALWSHKGCSDQATCPNLKLNLRNLVADWGRSEKKNQSRLLLAAYQAYVSLFKDDVEMWYWLAQTARHLKETRLAANYYRQASVLAAPAKPTDAKEKEKLNGIFEASLLGEIEMAESAKDLILRESAYAHYLELNPKGAKAFEIRYQLTYLAYDRKDFNNAAEGFRVLALDQTCTSSKNRSALCVKSADLALDSLVALKDDAKVETFAKEFASQFPERKQAYLKIARTSVLKQSSGLAASNNQAQALVKLGAISQEGMSLQERIAYFKTRIAVAERAQDLKEVSASAGQILNVKPLSESEREFALGRQEWAAEMALDFHRAYGISQKMKLSKFSAGDRLLRLALLAELAGQSPKQHEQNYLRLHTQGPQADAIRAKMVRTASSPQAELKKQLSYLKHDPDLLAPLALTAYAQTSDDKFAQDMLRIRGVRNQPAGMAMNRAMTLRDEAQMYAKVYAHRLTTSSDAKIQRSLAERLKLLSQAERLTQKAVGSGDWISQVVSLTYLAALNERTYTDILALPVPRRLNPKARIQYQALVAQKAQIYHGRAAQIAAKTNELWSHTKTFDALLAEFSELQPALKPMFAQQLQILASVAPESRKGQLKGILIAENERESLKELLAARESVKQQPFDASRLKRLMELERKQGKEVMVAYLDARLTQLEKPRGL